MRVQEQAEADRDGVRVPKEMVRIADWTEQKAAQGSGGAQGHEGGAPHRDLPPQLPPTSGINPNDVSSLREGHHQHRQGPHPVFFLAINSFHSLNAKKQSHHISSSKFHPLIMFILSLNILHSL